MHTPFEKRIFLRDYPRIVNNASIRHLRCFVAVAEEGSFARAADRLGLTHSALSATIKGAEVAMGVNLFHRTTRRVELTSPAAGFLPMARVLIRDFDTAIDDLRGQASGEGGHVRIATASSVMAVVLTPVIETLTAHHPDMRFTIRDGVSSDVQNRVLTGDAELGFTSRWQDDEALSFRPLLRDELGLVVREGHPLATSDSMPRWDGLAPWTYVALTLDTGTRVALQGAGVLPQPRHEVSTFTMLAPLLSAGDGFSIVPALFGSLPVARGLVFRRMARPTVSREICLITRRGRALSGAAQTVMAHVLRRLRLMDLPVGSKALR